MLGKGMAQFSLQVRQDGRGIQTPISASGKSEYMVGLLGAHSWSYSILDLHPVSISRMLPFIRDIRPTVTNRNSLRAETRR